MKIVIEEAAAADLDDAIRWIKQHSPRGAARIRRSVVAAVRRLANPKLSGMGRPGQISGTRELLEHPYVIVYRIDAASNTIVVQAIIHGARDRQSPPTFHED